MYLIHTWELYERLAKLCGQYKKHTESLGKVEKILSEFQRLRNSLAHEFVKSTQFEVVRPAYSLDED